MKSTRHRLALFMLIAISFAHGSVPALGADANLELDAAITLYRADGAERALPEFERLYQLFKERGDRFNAARAERYVGESHWQLGNYEQSRTRLDRALSAMRELGHRLEEAKTLNVLGLLAWDMGQYDQAVRNFNEAIVIGRELGEKRLTGSTLNNLSLVYDELGDYSTSIKQYRQALDLYQGLDFPRGESDTLGNIGGVYLLLGRYAEALVYYQRALEISETLKSKPSMSLDHGNMALCYLGLGQADVALEHFELALTLANEAGMRKEAALWQRGKANALIRKGQYDLGLENHRTALRTYEEIDARGPLLDALHDLGALYLMLGDPVSAEQYFQRGMRLAREIGHTQAITSNLLALGDLQFRREHYREAEDFYSRSLGRSKDAGELNYQTESLLRLSLVHLKLGRFDEADTEARQARSIAEATQAGFALAEAWYAAAELSLEQGSANAALEAFASARTTVAHSDLELSWQIHYGQARAYMQLGERQKAIDELQAALRIIESVRDRLREERFKAGYVQDKYQVYIDLVRLQLEMGKTQQAFSTAERLRARSFLDQLEAGGEVSRTARQRQEEVALQERIRQLQNALEREETNTPPNRRQLAIETFSSELLAAESEYQAFLDDIRNHSVIGRATKIPALDEIQARLKPGEALLEFVVADERVLIFVMHAGQLTAVSETLRRTDLFAKINLLRDLIQDTKMSRWQAPAASLSSLLIQPLQEDHLLEGVDHLFLVPHGILNYLPFAVLPLDPANADRSLIQRYTLTYLPAAATLVHVKQNADAPQSLLALAPASTGLHFALQEAQSISELYKPQSRLLAGAQATESAFKQQAGNFSMLHFSTHGYFNSRNPLLSGLELEADEDNDGLLEVHEILNLTLNAALVTLSACETALASGYFNAIPAGDDFVGLTRAFMLAGGRSVLATLWQVDDRSTVEIMNGFYQRLRPSGGARDQATALVRAQRELRDSANYRHPFYWAPFVLVGG